MKPVATAMALTLVAAGGPASALAADFPPQGAMSCSGCHANARDVETPAPHLSGMSADAIIGAMRAFRSGEKPATIMDRIAKGFDDGEIVAIATWYASRKD